MAASCPDLRGHSLYHDSSRLGAKLRQSQTAEQPATAGVALQHQHHGAAACKDSPYWPIGEATAAEIAMTVDGSRTASPAAEADSHATDMVSPLDCVEEASSPGALIAAVQQPCCQTPATFHSFRPEVQANPEQHTHASSAQSCSTSTPGETLASSLPLSAVLPQASPAEGEHAKSSPVPSLPSAPEASSAEQDQKLLSPAATSSSPVLGQHVSAVQGRHLPLASSFPGRGTVSPAEQDPWPRSPAAVSSAASSPSTPAGAPLPEQHVRPSSGTCSASQASAYGLLPDPRSFIGQLQQQGEGIYRVATQWQALTPWSRRPAPSADLPHAQQDSKAGQEIQLQQQSSRVTDSTQTQSLLQPDGSAYGEALEANQPETASSRTVVHNDAAEGASIASSERVAGCVANAADPSQAVQLVRPQ